jgi:hypothetical protein
MQYKSPERLPEAFILICNSLPSWLEFVFWHFAVFRAVMYRETNIVEYLPRSFLCIRAENNFLIITLIKNHLTFHELNEPACCNKRLPKLAIPSEDP